MKTIIYGLAGLGLLLLILPTCLHQLGFCRHRTTTHHQSVFNLGFPATAEYDFSKRANGVLITIPPGRKWDSDYAFHDTQEACVALEVIEGSWSILSLNGPNFVGHVGSTLQQRPGDYLKYAMVAPSHTRASILVTRQPSLYHLLCSIVQDADKYFTFCTTPAWQRIMYYATYLLPFVGAVIRRWMVSGALWLQLRVIYAANDVWTYEGRLYFGWVVFPPQWLEDLEWKSKFVISRYVVRLAACMGSNVGRMKDTYSEYVRV